jgi:hypothetical protein
MPGLGQGGGAGLVTGLTGAAAASTALSAMVGMARSPASPAIGTESIDPGSEAELRVIAGCMGLTPEEYLELINPTRGEHRSPTREETKRQATFAQKVDTRRYQACMMQQQSAPPRE